MVRSRTSSFESLSTSRSRAPADNRHEMIAIRPNHDCAPSTRSRRVLRHAAGVLFASMAVLAGCAPYHKCGFAGCAGDPRITADVEARLYANLAIESWGIKVQTLDRVVYLYGLVDTDLERNLIESTARDIPGVRSVVNAIAVRNQVW